MLRERKFYLRSMNPLPFLMVLMVLVSVLLHDPSALPVAICISGLSQALTLEAQNQSTLFFFQFGILKQHTLHSRSIRHHGTIYKRSSRYSPYRYGRLAIIVSYGGLIDDVKGINRAELLIKLPQYESEQYSSRSTDISPTFFFWD